MMFYAYYALFVLDVYAAKHAAEAGEMGDALALAMLGLFFATLAVVRAETNRKERSK